VHIECAEPLELPEPEPEPEQPSFAAAAAVAAAAVAQQLDASEVEEVVERLAAWLFLN
jgi:hypothetical protein